MRNVPGRSALSFVAALLLTLLVATSASAFSITRVSVEVRAPNTLSLNGRTPTTEPTGPLPSSGSAAAGAHPVFDTRIDFSDTGAPTADSVNSLSIKLAPGVLSYISNVLSCTTFDASSTAATNCPDSVVGSTTTAVTAQFLTQFPPAPLPPVIPPGNIPLALPGTIYRIPSPDPARYPTAFGIEIPSQVGGAPIKLVSPISINPDGLGLVASLSGLPHTAAIPFLGDVPIHIDSITQTLYGYSAAGRGLFTNPTSCIDAPVSVTATSYANATGRASDSYTPTDCGNVPFSTSLAATANPSTNDSPSAISVDVQPANVQVPRITSHVRETTVVLPPGVLINSALAARLDACTDAGFSQSNTGVAANCPASSAVGDINFVSPILGQFPGRAYFGTSTPTDLLRLFLDVPLFGAHIKISAHVRPDPNTGQVTTIFDALPQIAFTDFQLTFRGGQQSALVTPTTCGTNTATAVVSPWSGGPVSTPSGSFTTSGDGRGGPCSRTFAPTIAASVGSTKAGVSTPFTLKVNRPDRTVPFRSMKISMPPGLIGKIALPGLTQCSLAQAAAASCPASSRVGSAASVVGSGSEPPTLPGDVYLAAPKAAGDPASLAIVVPAKLGPVDTGTIVVGARLTLRGDGGLDVVSDAIPALQRGIPLAIQQLTITLDKPGFMQNPSSCGAHTITGSFEALDGGAGASTSTQLTTTDCGAVPFAPQISASVSGSGLTKSGAHPALTTLIQQKVGEGAIRTAKVTLPRTLSTNVAALLAGCSPAKLAANACPRSSQVAKATANSPLVAQPLSGPVYLIVERGRVPRLRVQLRGPVAVDLNGIISFARGGGLITTFDNIPDLALTRFQLAFHSGRLGVMSVVNNLCSPTPKISATFTGHSGRVTNQSHPIAVTGCPPAASASMRFRGSSGTLSAKVSIAKIGKPLAAVTVTLPKGLGFTRGGVVAKAGKTSLKGRATRVKGRTITLDLGRKGASSVTLRVGKVTASSTALARKLSSRKAKLRLTVSTRDMAKHRTKGTIALRLR
ncbi:MAG: hypothetical protein JWQ48_1060 [Conexibacter sp.]|nr:hypothetical protein [Conexibacter sp.]